MNDEHSSMAMSSISHAAEQAGYRVQMAAAAYDEPCVLYRPRLSIDGNQWCALYGDNIQDGVAGFGESPSQAMRDFNIAWYKPLKGDPHE